MTRGANWDGVINASCVLTPRHLSMLALDTVRIIKALLLFLTSRLARNPPAVFEIHIYGCLVFASHH